MADYTRYSVEPEDIPRRRRERKKKQAKSAQPRLARGQALRRRRPARADRRARRRRRRHLRALARPAVARHPAARTRWRVNTIIYDRTGKILIAELHGGQNRVLVSSDADPRRHEGGHRGRRGRALLRAPRRRLPRRRARHAREPARRQRRAGRLHHHRAVRQERLHRRRAHLHAQDPRGGARLAARGQVEQGPDPHRVPQHRVLRRRRLRRRGGGAHVLPQARVEQLNLKEAALLAALPKFPSAYSTDDRQGHGHAAAQQGAAAHGRPGLHHAGSAPTSS